MATGPSSPPEDELEECHPIASFPPSPLFMNLRRHTDQSLALITVDGMTHPFLAVKNYILKKIHLIETSGGRLLGMSGEGESYFRGCRQRPANIIALSCFNNQCAWELFRALRLKYEFPQDVDYFIIDLCNCTANTIDYPLMEICLYEVRDNESFNERYMRELPKLVCDQNGHLIAGTQKITQMMGALTSNFCTISQWKNCADYHMYHEKVTKLLNESQSACVRKALADFGSLSAGNRAINN
ncbi:unnamed protein product [Hymenolepis diminuta]|uniref:Uncharacterized protein n=1 Tax=Hymenolepis diminuta TaxID=6216 RepID=A0A564XZA2_HYMDI|nr:unnamed protein product [Hymenolepis diminuta]